MVEDGGGKWKEPGTTAELLGLFSSTEKWTALRVWLVGKLGRTFPTDTKCEIDVRATMLCPAVQGACLQCRSCLPWLLILCRSGTIVPRGIKRTSSSIHSFPVSGAWGVRSCRSLQGPGTRRDAAGLPGVPDTGVVENILSSPSPRLKHQTLFS
jgi:hypothetical protein